MSRRAARVPAALAIALTWGASAPAVATAQLTDGDLLRQIDSLAPLLREAQSAADRSRRQQEEERARRPRTPLDTLHIGAITVLVPPDQREVASELFTEVWREDFSQVEASPTLERVRFAFQWRARLQTMDFGPREEAGTIRSIAISRVWEPSREGVKQRIRQSVGAALVLDFDNGSRMGRWLAVRGHPASEDIYRLLLGTRSGANRACIDGDARACWAMLGLGLEEAGPRLADWFAPPILSRMVVDASEVNGSTLDRDDPAVRACTEDLRTDACVGILEDVGWAPTARHANRANAHMLWFAVRMGGAGAWSRALERLDASPADVLTHVAGVPAYELARSWRDSVVASRPDVHAGLATTRWVVPLWFLLLAALALRSTRWRLG